VRRTLESLVDMAVTNALRSFLTCVYNLVFVITDLERKGHCKSL
jgi:hypothetical protein